MIITCLTIIVLALQLHAREFHVSNSTELNDSIAMATGNRDAKDTIFLSAGIYTGNHTLDTIRIIADETNEITICAEEGKNAEQIIWDGNRNHILTITTEAVLNIIIQDITFQNGRGFDGSISLMTKGKCVIRNCIFKNNITIPIKFRFVKEAIISNSFFINNNVNAILRSEGSEKILIKNNLFRNNTAYNGSNIEVSKCKAVTIDSNIITEESSSISINYNENAIIKNNLIYNNTGSHISGHIIITYGGKNNVIISNNTIISNSCQDPCHSSIDAALYISPGGYSASYYIYNNIFWNNYGMQDIYINDFTNFTALYNNIYYKLRGPVDESFNNTSQNPLFVDIHNNDYHLAPDSPCINTGSNNVPDLPETDLDGNPRINDTFIDIGAYEFSTTEKIPSDQNEDWALTQEEFNAYAEAWRNGETWHKGPETIPIDYVTRSGYLQKKGENYKNEGGKKPTCWKPFR